jgi:hypothetical protein
LDDVFIELASRWDSLSTNTQRYIATIAAGSRQQSRFIAMMSDYARTQELVSKAQTASGASAKQFAKTMEGIDAKINQLTNAWNTFLLSIANSDLIKTGTEILAGLINGINGFTDALGKFSGVAKIMLVVGALYLADKALKAFIIGFGQSKSVLGAFGGMGKTIFGSMREDINKTSISF